VKDFENVYGHHSYTSYLEREEESAILIDWFVNNKMKANPDKFQVIAIGNK
jgi:hypothetical protein